MNLNSFIAASLLTTAFASPASADDLGLNEAELDNLGVEFATPRRLTAGGEASVGARAYVVVPPDRDHVIASPNSGLVLRMHAATGQRVAAGELLAEVQSPDFLGLQQMFIEAEQNAAVARSNLRRDQQLHSEGIIAARRLEETRAQSLAAVAAASEHRQLLRISGMSVDEIDTLAADGALVAAMAMRAPVAGVILETRVTVGDNVDSAQALYRLADVSELWLDIQLPQEQADSVASGMRVEVVSPVANHAATVRSVGESVDASTQTVSVRAILEPGTRGLRPGQLTTVSIFAGRSEDALALPLSALIRSGSQAYVFVRVPGGVNARKVVVSGQTQSQAFVSGFDINDEIAVRGVSALKAVWLETLAQADE